MYFLRWGDLGNGERSEQDDDRVNGVAVAGGVLTGWLLWLAVKFRRDRTRPSARRLFFATLAYLPIALIVVLAGSRQG